MIKFENTEVVGFDHAIRGMRNPRNSWGKSDTKIVHYDTMIRQLPGQNKTLDNCRECDIVEAHDEVVHILKEVAIGENDEKLMKQLCKAGTDHRKFLRMITVYVDISAPLYWWKEFDTYKVGTVTNSCSTMHKIAEKEFTLDDFSTEHLIKKPDNGDIRAYSINALKNVIDTLNYYRDKFLKTKDKKYWWQMIQLLPSSYNQRRTLMLNYEVLANMYHARKNHKLDEWRDFCKWIKSLPHSDLIIGEEE